MGRIISFGSIRYISDVKDLNNCRVDSSVFLACLCLIMLIQSLVWEGGSIKDESCTIGWFSVMVVLDMAS